MSTLPTGLLAINPRAFLAFAVESYEPPATVLSDGVAVVAIRGALTTYRDSKTDSYECILERVTKALERSQHLVLEFDSPGGLCAGLFECAREIRRLVDSRGATLTAYVRGQACSAAYALACVAHEVWCAPEAMVGSIGVIDALVDATVQDLLQGLKYSVIASGERKADGNPHVETTAEAVAASGEYVAEMARMFFGHVERYRGVPAAQVQALQAGTFTGQRAHELTLVTRLGSLFECVHESRLMAPPTQTKDTEMKSIIEALAAVAAGDDPAEAAKAKALIASLAAEDESKEEPSAEDAPPAEEESEEEEAPASTAAVKAMAAQVRAMQAQVQGMRAERTAEKLAAERAALLATRPDLSAETHAELATASIKEIQLVLKNIPRSALGVAEVSAPTAGSTIQTLGALDADAQRAFDAALKKPSNLFAITHEPTRAVFGGRS